MSQYYQINVRGPQDNADFCQAIETVTGVKMPQQVNHVVCHNQTRLMQLGPDEWLVVTNEPQMLEALISKQQKLADQNITTSVVDLSSARCIIPVSMPVIHAYCPIETDWPDDQIIQTVFGHVDVILEKSNSMLINVFVLRSMQPYVAELAKRAI